MFQNRKRKIMRIEETKYKKNKNKIIFNSDVQVIIFVFYLVMVDKT